VVERQCGSTFTLATISTYGWLSGFRVQRLEVPSRCGSILCHWANLPISFVDGEIQPKTLALARRHLPSAKEKAKTFQRERRKIRPVLMKDAAVPREQYSVVVLLKRHWIAKLVNAKTIGVNPRRLSLISHPDQITRLILDAAGHHCSRGKMQ
jgi:hypothetical protein